MLERCDPKMIPPHKEGYFWIGNSGQSTAEEAIRGYVKAFSYQKDDLIAESFSPELGITFAVYKRLLKEGD